MNTKVKPKNSSELSSTTQKRQQKKLSQNGETPQKETATSTESSQDGSWGEDEQNPVSLFRISTLVYGVMGLIGAAAIFYGHKSASSALGMAPLLADPVRLLGSAGLAAGLLLIISYFFEDWFASYQELKSTIMRMLGPVSWPMALYLAVISAVGEELLFRGAIQPLAGLILTSVLFGLLHLGQDGRITSWSIWAMIAGLMLGWLFEETGSLWPPILAHALVNGFSIMSLRRSYQTFIGSQSDCEGNSTDTTADSEFNPQENAQQEGSAEGDSEMSSQSPSATVSQDSPEGQRATATGDKRPEE